VLVDLRVGSPTFAQWCGEELTAENRAMLYVPEGFAHGFQTLLDGSEVDYEITQSYVPELARGVRYDDPTLAIRWPIEQTVVSLRDQQLPFLERESGHDPVS
jgi:dTDP-4-dehydrorhamnose 3,5-epimerase